MNDPNEILKRERDVLRRPCRKLASPAVETGDLSVMLLVYEYDDPTLGTTVRYALAVNGRTVTSGVVGYREPSGE